MDRPGQRHPRRSGRLSEEMFSEPAPEHAAVKVPELLARCTFPPAGTAVDCAVSGGPDSLALLVLASEAGCAVTAWHVDHGLRPGSAAEAEVVAQAATRWGAAFEARTAHCEPGPNLEARARQARYGVLPAGVLTGHTADDQAETVLLNLMRGAGLDGLAGIDPTRRPLLGLRRHETQALCEAQGLDPVQDPSNLDPAHRRNRIRHELLPLLYDIAERDVVPIIARGASLTGGVRDLLDELAAAIDPTDARALAQAPEPLAQMALRRWIQRETDADHPPDAAAIERVMAVVRNEARSTEIGGGWRVTRSSQRLGLQR
ncbi:MAG: tRNA lysidine(34) synthetase TilS [Acidimicrobiia bacterium]|nr:tRNA lysidine(34) synthetase TilS [Acidimicrobiia bacterium]MYG57734.1 tRNA lysidine(34) synthetase TilS [Acidimicrobiia bacterium]MYJ32123.1 tRNA lysidine(34) synthetase TilS [Acidimicrobiia bacterium]